MIQTVVPLSAVLAAWRQWTPQPTPALHTWVAGQIAVHATGVIYPDVWTTEDVARWSGTARVKLFQGSNALLVVSHLTGHLKDDPYRFEVVPQK